MWKLITIGGKSFYQNLTCGQKLPSSVYLVIVKNYHHQHTITEEYKNNRSTNKMKRQINGLTSWSTRDQFQLKESQHNTMFSRTTDKQLISCTQQIICVIWETIVWISDTIKIKRIHTWKAKNSEIKPTLTYKRGWNLRGECPKCF